MDVVLYKKYFYHYRARHDGQMWHAEFRLSVASHLLPVKHAHPHVRSIDRHHIPNFDGLPRKCKPPSVGSPDQGIVQNPLPANPKAKTLMRCMLQRPHCHPSCPIPTYLCFDPMTANSLPHCPNAMQAAKYPLAAKLADIHMECHAGSPLEKQRGALLSELQAQRPPAPAFSRGGPPPTAPRPWQGGRPPLPHPHGAGGDSTLLKYSACELESTSACLKQAT